jgi:histidinol phosphatase-like enzyme
MVNLLCDMDFVLADSDLSNDDSANSTKFHRLVKQTETHLIIITYEIRKRLICPPKPEDDPGFMRKATDITFGSFLKKFGFLPPNMINKE